MKNGMWSNSLPGDDLPSNMKESNESYGGTPNSMPGYSIADQKKDVLRDESAKTSDLDVGDFQTMPVKSIRNKA